MQISNGPYQKKGLVISINSGSLIQYIADLLTLIFVLLAFGYYLVDHRLLGLRLYAMLIAGFMGYVVHIVNYKRLNNSSIMYLVVLIFSWLFCFLIRGDGAYEFTNMLCSVAYIGIALNVVNHKHNYKIYSAIYYLVSLYILYLIYIVHKPIYQIMQDGSSYNFISVTLIFFYMLAQLVRIQNEKKLSILDTLLFFFVTILAFGRGGILTGLILIILVFIRNYIDIHDRKKLLILAIMIVASIFIYINIDAILSLITSNGYAGKFAVIGMSNNGRFEIWQKYLLKVTEHFSNVVVGVDPYSVFTDGNLHNSFLQMHASYGIVFLIINIYYLIKSSIYDIKAHKVELAILLFGLVLRAMTDKLMYHGLNECMLYIMIFEFLHLPKSERINPVRN